MAWGCSSPSWPECPCPSPLPSQERSGEETQIEDTMQRKSMIRGSPVRCTLCSELVPPLRSGQPLVWLHTAKPIMAPWVMLQ